MVQARLREAAFLEKHVLLKNLRDALESLRGRVVGRNKDDVEEAISMLVQCYTQVSILYKLVFLLEMPDGQVEGLAVHLTQREGELIQEKTEVKKLANFLKQVEGLAVHLTQREGELIQEKTEVKKLANFLKQVKRDYVESLNDSLDLVLIGAWHGNGRKLQEAPTLGSFNPEKGELVLAQFKGDNEILPNLPHSCSEKTLP
ncbi:hypothetical protein POM88_045245 [Heracleum sosnowskyi]|uniref:ATP-dependent DNA ligase family profile domain-containing protein n=1 Tax=Heracleum sosnowskyi TaxID=360622 RepID=A0AAD8H5K8_9APIA|nr:hypothetical protein POM88_045245 [Heracleum sosnowskyi]